MISIRVLFFGKSDSLYRPANLSNLGDSDFPFVLNSLRSLKRIVDFSLFSFSLVIRNGVELPGSLHVEISDLFFSVYAFEHFHSVFYF